MISSELLLGNGINIAFDKDAFSAISIKQRFLAVLKKTEVLYQALFNIDISDETLEEIRKLNPRMNIEELADVLYKIIWDYCLSHGERESVNLKKRIVETIKISALTAIFIDEDHALVPNIPLEKASQLKRYNHIYSLNYYEYWNPQPNNCTYLHGFIPLEVMKDLLITNSPSIFYDEARYNCINYNRSSTSAIAFHNAVNVLKKDYQTFSLIGPPILFSPSLQDKIELAGNYPSELNFPCWDSFPSSTPRPYSNLKNTESLSILGVSPYGDFRLAAALNNIPHLQIYVHDLFDKHGEKEKADWKNFSLRNQ